jgi:hypothetical protein
MRRDQTHQPITVEQLARELPEKAWREVAWREGSKETLRSRFAALRVRPASDRKGGLQPEQARTVVADGVARERRGAKRLLVGTFASETLAETVGRD